MIKNILSILSMIIFFVWGKFFADNESLRYNLVCISYTIFATLIIEFITFLWAKRRFLALYWNCYTYKRLPELRLTISYLFKIEVQGKYLLVKSSRLKNTYQPVGGVYKYFNPEANTELNVMSIETDNKIPSDQVSEYDLRLTMANRKNMRKFLEWFNNNQKRELDPWREFYEELVATKILDENIFKYIQYNLVGQHFEPIHYDTHFKIDTFKYANIYTLRCVNSKQEEAIRKITEVTNSKYHWATKDEIINKITIDGKRIADHTPKIFHHKFL